MCLPGVLVSVDEGRCKQKVEILRDLRDLWAWAYRWHIRNVPEMKSASYMRMWLQHESQSRKFKSFILVFSLAQVRTLGTFSLTNEWTFIIRRT